MNPLGTRPAPQANPMLQNIAETIRFAQTFKSPEAFMQELQRQNPEMAHQLMQLSQSLQNPMQTAQQMLAQQGVTPQQLNAVLGQN